MNRISFLNRGYAFKGLLAVNKVSISTNLRPQATNVLKIKIQSENLRLSVNCLYGYVLENFELSHR